MKKTCVVSLVALSALAMTACKDKPKTDTIIVKKPVAKAEKPVGTMGDNVQRRDVKWLGATYHIIIERKADRSLPLALDESGNRYYDNRVSLTIERPDGTEFFSRVFVKSDFDEYVDETNSDGALLGIVFDNTDGESLRFAASIGSPDKMSDDYVPLLLTVSRTGGVTVAKDDQLDTASDDADDDGV